MKDFIIIIAVVLSFFGGIKLTESYQHFLAVHHQAAHYDSTTGNFMWNSPYTNNPTN